MMKFNIEDPTIKRLVADQIILKNKELKNYPQLTDGKIRVVLNRFNFELKATLLRVFSGDDHFEERSLLEIYSCIHFLANVTWHDVAKGFNING